MDKNQKLEKLFNPDAKDILLSDFLAPHQIRDELAEFLVVKNEREMLDRLNTDFYYLSCRDISQNETSLKYYKGPALFISDTERECPFGIRWHRKVKDDKFSVDETISGPFSGNTFGMEDIYKFKWPSPQDFEFSGLSDECDEFSDKIIVGGLWSAIQGDGSRMMGFENFLLNIAMSRSLVKALVDRITEVYLELNRSYFELVKGKMDVFFMGNDFGSQNGLLFSEEDWYDIYYENYKKLIDFAHSYGFRVMVHSCGSIDALIPHFISLGVDILDPVQITTRNMEPGYLGLKYGKDIVFHGALDTQKVLSFGTPGETKDHCMEVVRKLNTNGNLIAAPSNNFMNCTPVANIMAVYDTLNILKSEYHEKS